MSNLQSASKRRLLRSLLLEALWLSQEQARRKARNKWRLYYPDVGNLRRELYPKHLEFFAAGKGHRERLFLAANRIGKTEAIGGYEMMLHLTGLYPEWWPGREFDRPVDCWVAGTNAMTTRDIIQTKLLGPMNSLGTGIIPGDHIIGRPTLKQGIRDAVDQVLIRHTSGRNSILGFKSYEAGRRSFEGTEKDVIWLDEEPPMDVYAECLIRTMTTKGMLILTFTPLLGLSDVVLSFMPEGKIEQ